ncbi:MAG: GNAT family N-acetyltransferase [Bdellovibrionales bacterium]|nr:GNAT family N-acetyltransferase [Bdellovibrionales bacterium]
MFEPSRKPADPLEGLNPPRQDEHLDRPESPHVPRPQTVFTVRHATPEDAQECYALEEAFCITHGHSEDMGFFLPGTSLEQYQTFQRDAHAEFLVIREGEELCGYLIVLHPSNPHVQRLQTECFDKITFDSPEAKELFLDSRLCLPGKIAVTLDRRKQGIAGLLIEAFFEEHPQWGAFTTTLLEPKFNRASANLCARLGFQRIGTFDHGERPGIGQCISQLVYLEPGSLPLASRASLRHLKPRDERQPE